MGKKHFNIRVYGMVQGVFFRASARLHAQALGVTGFARNEDDGSVYVEAEGEEGNLRQFVEWCHRGPDRARVTKVDLREAVMKNYSSFEVKRGIY